MFETIVALATPPLKSALAIVRLSGDDCFDIVGKCFNKDLTKIKTRTTLVGSIYDKDTKIDDVVLIAYVGPKSFTGENSIEIMCHGSILIANEIISIMIKNGARYATNGEFSSRAFLHNRIDLIQAESINDVINATTKEAKQLSLMSLDGKVSSLVLPIKTRLADIISLIEVNIDFPEYEDIEVANKETIISFCDEIIPKIEALLVNGEKAKIIKDGINVALVGKPNVGKSSILNSLLGEEKAIVTDVAGTTRDVVEGELSIKGIPLHILDTAGLRETKDKIESIGINKTIKVFQEADLVIVVLDSSSQIDEEDKRILDLTKDYPRLIVYNKSDISLIDKKDEIFISSLNNDIQPLIDAILDKLGIDESSYKIPSLNNSRQLGLLKKAVSSLTKAREDSINNISIDLVSVSIMDAYLSILEILGETNQVDLSKEIFSRFCVGK